MNDPSLQQGDIVATSKGLLMFIGRNHDRRQPEDFLPAPNRASARVKSIPPGPMPRDRRSEIRFPNDPSALKWGVNSQNRRVFGLPRYKNKKRLKILNLGFKFETHCGILKNDTASAYLLLIFAHRRSLRRPILGHLSLRI